MSSPSGMPGAAVTRGYRRLVSHRAVHRYYLSESFISIFGDRDYLLPWYYRWGHGLIQGVHLVSGVIAEHSNPLPSLSFSITLLHVDVFIVHAAVWNNLVHSLCLSLICLSSQWSPMSLRARFLGALFLLFISLSQSLEQPLARCMCSVNSHRRKHGAWICSVECHLDSTRRSHLQ